ncbi:MAG: hypothetical protein WBN94_09670 [Methanothrix sp.]
MPGNQTRPDDIAAQAGPTGGSHKQQPGPERRRARPCGGPALLPVARKNRYAGDCQELPIKRLCALCVSAVRSVAAWL